MIKEPSRPRSDNCVMGVENREKLKALDERQKRFEENVSKRLDTFEEAINLIKDRLLGRPSWFVTITITLLTATTTGFGVWALAVTRILIEIK